MIRKGRFALWDKREFELASYSTTILFAIGGSFRLKERVREEEWI